MANDSSFLSLEDAEEFEKADRFKPRFVLSPELEGQGSPQPQELTAAVISGINKTRRTSGKWFGCHCVTVRADDGMSWSAEAVRRRSTAAFPEFSVVAISRRLTREFPHIGQLMGERVVMKAAVRRKLARWYPTLYLSHASFVVAGIWAFGAIAAIVKVLLKEHPLVTPVHGDRSDVAFLALAGVAAVISVGSKLLTDRFSSGQKEKSIQDFMQKVGEYENDGGTLLYENLVEDLAKQLKWVDRPRIVIVDNYERLDTITRAVIHRYFRSYCKDAAGSEFWAVFEGRMDKHSASSVNRMGEASVIPRPSRFGNNHLALRPSKSWLRLWG